MGLKEVNPQGLDHYEKKKPAIDLPPRLKDLYELRRVIGCDCPKCMVNAAKLKSQLGFPKIPTKEEIINTIIDEGLRVTRIKPQAPVKV